MAGTDVASERGSDRAGWVWVVVIVVALWWFFGGDDGDEDTTETGDDPVSEVVLEAALAATGREAFSATRVPYRVHQAEFQHYQGTLTWVYQVDDPTDAALRADENDMNIVLFDAPLSAYAAAVRPHWDSLRQHDVDTYILSFRNPEQTVYEIPPHVLDDLVHRRRRPREVLDDIIMSALQY